jgi:hypothetical protein
MEVADEGAHRHDEILVFAWFHPRLLLRFKHAEERQSQGLADGCCMPSECHNLDMAFAQKPEDLTS